MRLIQLLTPAFSESGLNPGYIKGYVPGVRENGGQYSHAAIWALMSFAQLEEREKVYELFSLVQPINHALDAEGVQKYKVEPYVMAADVYSSETHKGRGGWTWYTGSAGWMYQFIINSLLGIQVNNNKLKVKPCFPLEWPSVRCQYKYGDSLYNIIIFQENTAIESWWKLGETIGAGDQVTLVDDGGMHELSFHINV